MITYDGISRAAKIEVTLQSQVADLARQGVRITIAAILFEEDSGSRLYTKLKGEAAARVGIAYQVHTFSVTDAIETVAQTVSDLNQNQNVTGIIIQKPWRKTWQRAQNSQSTASEYAQWWSALTAKIAPEKDVDGLHPQTLQAIQDGTWQEQGRVLPATAQAVLTILEDINQQQKKPLNANKISIIGTSDLLGRPLFFELKRRGVDVELLGRKELQEKNNSGIGLQESSIIISATGVRHLITADLISEGTSLIDVGEPRPDVDFESVRASGKAAHITPVPGGVGPLTIVSLLQNAVVLAKQ